MKDKKDCYTRILYNYTYYLGLSTYTDIYLPYLIPMSTQMKCNKDEQKILVVNRLV